MKEEEKISAIVEVLKLNKDNLLHIFELESNSAAGRLDLLNPLAVLERGYSIVSSERNENVITNSNQVSENDGIHIKLHVGNLAANIRKVSNGV